MKKLWIRFYWKIDRQNEKHTRRRPYDEKDKRWLKHLSMYSVGSIMGFTEYIYKLHCKDNNINDVYIGSTQNLRKCAETTAYHSNHDTKISCRRLYRAIRKSGGYSNWEMIVLEEFRGHCEKDRAILNQRKREYKKQYMASLNGYTIAKTKEIEKKSV